MKLGPIRTNFETAISWVLNHTKFVYCSQENFKMGVHATQNRLLSSFCKVLKCEVGSRPGILYGLCKVHKAITDICPTFRPVLSAVGTPIYKLAKFLVSKLSITFNEFTVKDSFAFSQEIVPQNNKLFMGSLDVDSLFTNGPLIFVLICFIIMRML